MLAIDEWTLKQGYLGIGAQKSPRASGSKKRGIDFEKKVIQRLAPFVREAMPEWTLLVGPWYRNNKTRRWRQPDAVLVHEASGVGIVIEVKLNWKEGRDEKLLDVYLPLVKRAHGLKQVWPLIVVGCTRGYPHPVILQLKNLTQCRTWLPGDPTPMMLVLC